MPNELLWRSIYIVQNLIEYRKRVRIDADGTDDRVYPSDVEWEAIEHVLNAVQGEF